MSFFTAVGFGNNPQFTDETAACMVVSDDIYVMLLTHAKFKEFTPRQICDVTKSTELLNCLSCESRGHVDELVRKALASGGSTYAESKDHGFMYQHGFQDHDGHIWTDGRAGPRRRRHARAGGHGDDGPQDAGDVRSLPHRQRPRC